MRYDILDRYRETFFARTKAEGYCLEWQGYLEPSGYGRISLGPRKPRFRVLSHRAAYYYAHGQFDPDACVLHTCDNRKCVKAEHLFLGTRAENNDDRDAKGRHWTHLAEDHARALFTNDQVRAMRKARSRGETYQSVGDRYGTTKSTAWRICTGKSYGSVV